MPRHTLLLLAAVLGATLSPAQTAVIPPAEATKPLIFDVASIRPNPKEQYFGVIFNSDGARAVGISVRNLIYAAYDQRHDELWSGGPSWISSEHYDLTARIDVAQFPNLTEEQRREMLQTLLADRFHLVVRRETKILSHYALVIAKGGPNLQETKAENIKLDADNNLYCRAGVSAFKQCTMAEFANIVSWLGPSPVIDDGTGLAGRRYDFTVSWAPHPAGSPTGPDTPPDFITAIREQLGLELKPVEGPVDTFVIVQVERPTAN